jgi:putative FmdB family regulatory protein
MPVFDFQCTTTECNHIEEDYYLTSNEAPPACPKCGKPDMKKMLTTKLAISMGKGTSMSFTHKGSKCEADLTIRRYDPATQSLKEKL